jgi:hypothetical protein
MSKSWAFFNLLPAFSQATKKSVFLLTLETKIPQTFSRLSINLSLEIFLPSSQIKLQVIQTFFWEKIESESIIFSS